MKLILKPSNIFGSVRVPSSKSVTHRALTLAAISNGLTTIKNPLTADDTDATERVLKSLGAKIIKKDDEWQVVGGELKSSNTPLDCGESGTTLRIMTAVTALVNGESQLIGGSSLTTRPIGPLIDALKMIGVDASCNNGYPPTKIQGYGKIIGGKAILPGNISSQFISALLIISPLAQSQVIIEVNTPLESKSYVTMTLSAMRDFGVKSEASPDLRSFRTPIATYKPTTVEVEGDWSSAAYMLAAGVLTGEVTVTGLNNQSGQPDASIIEILELMDANIHINNNLVRVSKSPLKNISYDLSDCPDLFPIVSALCSKAKGISKLTGLERLKIKESNRLQAMVEGLLRMGVEVKSNFDSCVIKGGETDGAEINTYNDHRIAMSFAILSLTGREQTIIQNAESVKKSYPNFWEDLRVIGAQITGDDV
jgi:3-phosphoshikimate 1-carboxyvinyltransferase